MDIFYGRKFDKVSNLLHLDSLDFVDKHDYLKNQFCDPIYAASYSHDSYQPLKK